MSHHEIIVRVRDYIAENYLYMRRDFTFDDGDSLLGRGIIDSMGVIELIAFVQEEFGIPIADDEITEENLGTLWRMATFINGKLEPQSVVC